MPRICYNILKLTELKKKAQIVILLGAVIAVLTLIPLSVSMLARARWKSLVWALILSACTASVAWFVRGLNAEMWKSEQSMHIRWNITCFSDQYERIDRLVDENLRRDYVTNFCQKACILLGLEMKTAPNTSNIVERYYHDWDERIHEAEQAAKRRNAR